MLLQKRNQIISHSHKLLMDLVHACEDPVDYTEYIMHFCVFYNYM